MATVLDAIKKIDLFKQTLLNQMPNIAKETAAYVLDLQKAKIKKEGVGKYSTKVYSPGFLKGKELTQKGRSFLESKIQKKEKTNWAGLRSSEGLQINFVDLYYSGHMLNNTTFIRNNKSGLIFMVTIGGRTQAAKQRLFYNRQRYGQFLHPSKETEKVVLNYTLQKIGDIYAKSFNI